MKALQRWARAQPRWFVATFYFGFFGSLMFAANLIFGDPALRAGVTAATAAAFFAAWMTFFTRLLERRQAQPSSARAPDVES